MMRDEVPVISPDLKNILASFDQRSFVRRKLGNVETIEFEGHRNILGVHRNTIEVTKDSEISRRADCIIGVNANKSCSDFTSALKEHIKNGGHLAFKIVVEKETFCFYGRGSSNLELSDERELVLRKSDFFSARTGAVRCSAAAVDIPRSIIRKLQTPASRGKLKIKALTGMSNDRDYEKFV